MKRLLISVIAVLALSQCNCGFMPVDPSKSDSDGGMATGGGMAAPSGGTGGGTSTNTGGGAGSTGGGSASTGGGSGSTDGGPTSGLDAGVPLLDAGVPPLLDAGIAPSCSDILETYRAALDEAKKCVQPAAGQQNPCTVAVQTSVTCGCQTYVDSTKGAGLEIARQQLEAIFRQKRCLGEACPRCVDVGGAQCKQGPLGGRALCTDQR